VWLRLPRKTVHFREGSSNAVLNGLVQDFESVDYLLGARPEQSMTGRMPMDNRPNDENILAPGKK
jgi:hypothetical protein